MKKLALTLAHLLIITSLIAQQNAIWSLPPKYVKFPCSSCTPTPPIDLPIPTVDPDGIPIIPNTDPYDGYDGQVSNFNHNAMQDANGDLYFFIVDGFVYDFNGYFIGQIISDFSGDVVKGYTETIIVPVPGSCTQYYIIGEIFNASNHIRNVAEYAILDMSVTSYETGSQGALIGKSQQSDPPPYNQSAFWGNGFALTNSVPFPPNFSTGATQPEIKISMAASDLRSDNTRFLYIMGSQCIARYKVTASGIAYDNYEFVLNASFPFPSIENTTRSEMELIKTPTGYHIACSYPSTPTSNQIILFVGEINNNGDIISYNVKPLAQDVPSNSNLIAKIKGMEFSPNGQYLYITHDPQNNIPFPFKIYEVSTNTFIPLTNNANMQSQIPAFKNSQIELGKDGKLYLANATSLATIGNSNNPGIDGSGLIWNSTALTISYNLNQLGFATGSEGMKLYTLPDQIDGMNYTAYFTEGSLECCIKFSPFTTGIDLENNEHTTSGIWDNNINPYGAGVDVITVRDELVIKTGANITANNLTFKFAPNAKLVVESGAKFTVNNCTLTVENTCENSPMWNGVDVMGSTLAFGQQTGAGRFIANNSLIEHSYWAVHNFKTQSGGVLAEEYGPGFRGGVIIATNTTFRNNHRAMVFFDFQNKNSLGYGIDDQSRFTNCTFVTDGLLNKPALTPSVIMAHLFGVQGVNFLGCDFKNTASYATIQYVDRGMGISATNCLLTVRDLPTGGLSTDRSTFTDLLRGIEAYSTGSARTTNVIKTDFNNNWRGIYLKSNNFAIITSSTFDVGSDNGWGASYGLFLDACNKYKVEGNAFTTTHNGRVGVYVQNSGGANNNEIYRNTFNNFVIGSGAAGNNSNGSANAGGLGLEFRCNTYTNTSSVDIYVASGGIKPTHGQCINVRTPSNNTFSYSAFKDLWQEAYVTNHVTYQYSIGTKQEPRNSYINTVNTFPTDCPTMVFDPITSCPVRLTKGQFILMEDLATEKTIVATLTAQIDEGNTKGLLILIQSQVGNGAIKDALMSASPYLSDEVLIAYIQSNSPNGNLQQVLMANSPLSEEVLAVLQLRNLPKGIKTIVNNAQTGTSVMQELQIEIAYHKNEVENIKSDIIRYFLFDDAVEERLKEIIAFLNQGDCTQSKRQCDLAEFYIANKEYANATQELSALTSNIEDADYVKLFTNIIELEQTADPVQELATNPIKQQPIIEVAEAPIRKQETARAEVLLKRAKLRNYQETVAELNFSGSGLRLMNQEELLKTQNPTLITQNSISVYPNPTSNEVNITHNLNLENGKVTFKVYNMLGVEVINENLTATNKEVKINMLKAGVYFYIVIQNNQTIKTDKLMVR